MSRMVVRASPSVANSRIAACSIEVFLVAGRLIVGILVRTGGPRGTAGADSNGCRLSGDKYM